MEPKPTSMKMALNIWIENPEGEILFGDGRLQILQAIEKQGTLSAAAEKLGMSYRGLWARIRHSERRLGFALIETHAGRGPSSGTSLTPEGRSVMRRYTKLQKQVQTAARKAFRDIFTAKH